MNLSSDVLGSFEQSKEKIGELLIKNTLLTRNQLDEVLDYQEQHGGLLGDILIEKNYIQSHRV